jgi:hypothetical protein
MSPPLPSLHTDDSLFFITTIQRCDETTTDDRLATTSLIIARRIVASVNGNPEFDAAAMLRPYTYAYVSYPLS